KQDRAVFTIRIGIVQGFLDQQVVLESEGIRIRFVVERCLGETQQEIHRIALIHVARDYRQLRQQFLRRSCRRYRREIEREISLRIGGEEVDLVDIVIQRQLI